MFNSIRLLKVNDSFIVHCGAKKIGVFDLVQVQNLFTTVFKLRNDLLFDILCSFEENGHNYTDLGFTDEFIFSEKKVF